MFFVSLCQARLSSGSACQQTESHYQSMWLRLRCTASKLAFLEQICSQLMWAWRVSLFLVNLQHSDCIFHSSAIIVLDPSPTKKGQGQGRHCASYRESLWTRGYIFSFKSGLPGGKITGEQWQDSCSFMVLKIKMWMFRIQWMGEKNTRSDTSFSCRLISAFIKSQWFTISLLRYIHVAHHRQLQSTSNGPSGFCFHNQRMFFFCLH